MMDKLKNNIYDILDHISHIYTYQLGWYYDKPHKKDQLNLLEYKVLK